MAQPDLFVSVVSGVLLAGVTYTASALVSVKREVTKVTTALLGLSGRGDSNGLIKEVRTLRDVKHEHSGELAVIKGTLQNIEQDIIEIKQEQQRQQGR